MSNERGLMGAEMRLVSVILFIVEFVRGAVLISLLPIYGKDTLGLSPDIIGAAISAHYVTDTVLKIAIGYLLDRFPIRLVVQSGLVLALLGIYALQFATIPWMFIGAAALYGVGMSPIWIYCLTRVSSEKRATQMGFLYTVWLVGMGSGPILCNVLLDYFPASTYYVLMALSALAVFFGFFMPKSSRNSAELVTRITMSEQFRMLRDRLLQMKLLLPGMILQTMGASMLLPVLPSFANTELGMTGTQYSVLLLTGGVFAVGGLIPLGKLADKLGGKKWFLTIGFGFVALSLYFLSLGPSFWISMLIAVMLGISYSTMLPSWNALLAAYVPPQQEGVGWGVLSTFEGIGIMIGPLVGGLVATAWREPSVIWVSALLFGLIAVFYLFLPQRSYQPGEVK